MKQKSFLILIIITISLYGCKNEPASQDNSNNDKQAELVRIVPLEHLKQVDKILAEISEEPQYFSAPSNKTTKVTGAEGTIIYVDPAQLETVDGSPLDSNIQIELIEMTDNSSLILNNAQTVSNGQILVTGGAYYLNMTSNGKQLKMKQGKGLDVEFPKLTEDEMALFLGERDSLGQVNWTVTADKFKSIETQADALNFDTHKPTEPKKPLKANEGDHRVLSVTFEDTLILPELQHYNNVRFRVNDNCDYNPDDADNFWFKVAISKSKVEGEYIIDFDGVDKNGTRLNRKYEVTPVLEGEDYNTALKHYDDKYNEYLKRKAEIEVENEKQRAALEKQRAAMEKQRAEIEYQNKTYEAVQLMNFGWKNCDRFWNDPNPITDIQLLVNNTDSLPSARIYAVFKEVRSIVTEYYFIGEKEKVAFKDVPTGKELQIIALSAKDEIPYIFETTINTRSDRKVKVEFVATTQADIRKKMKRMN